MTDTTAVAAEKAKNRYMLRAALAVAACVVLGGFMFQSASLSFEYMKLRDLRLYMSASSLEAFARKVSAIDNEIESRDAPTLRGLIGARGTVDADLIIKDEAAKTALSNAKTALRRELTTAQKETSGYSKAGLTFTGIDGVFDKVCEPKDNDAAAAASLTIADPDAAEVPATPAAAPTAGPRSPGLVQACSIPANFCDRSTFDEGGIPTVGGARAKMICTQLNYQAADRKKVAVTSFSYDSSRAIGESLAIRYPGFKTEDAGAAIRIVEAYTSLAPAAVVDPARKPARTIGEKLHVAGDAFATSFWNVLLTWPLAITYLLLAFLFGGLGSLSRFLYYYANPNTENPAGGVLHNVLAGGGGAVLVLLIVMAGFQFLTVGASAPDLAYPNPLTVSAISVLSGLGGERVLEALNAFIGRIFGSYGGNGGGGNANGANPPAGGGANPPVGG